MEMIISGKCSLNVEALLGLSKDEFLIMYGNHNIDHEDAWNKIQVAKEKRLPKPEKEKAIITEPSKAGSHESDNKPTRKNGTTERRGSNGGLNK